MEMIIGGAYQGKTEYARKQYPQLRWSDGGSVTEEELMNAQGVTGFQQYIRSELENGKDVSDLAEKIICKNPDIVLVSQEVGYGVVPVDAFDRKYREAVGRVCTKLAAYESTVSGSMEGIKKNGEIYDTARMRSEELGSIGFFGAENLGTQTNVGKEVQVTYDLDTISSYGNLSWHLRTEGKSAVINPVKHIRRLRAAQAVLREMGE